MSASISVQIEFQFIHNGKSYTMDELLEKIEEMEKMGTVEIVFRSKADQLTKIFPEQKN